MPEIFPVIFNPPQAIVRADLGFATIPLVRHSPHGAEYTKMVEVGMPKIQQALMDTVFYLYRNKEDAEKGTDFGGTGFIISVPSKADSSTIYLYAVSNLHVACEGGFSVIRINTKSGGTDILELDPSDWHPHPDREDVAITFPIKLSKDHKYAHLTYGMLCTKKEISTGEIGPGDDIFMIGRFIDHDGGVTNMPAVRFGNISIDPSPITQPTGKLGLSYCLDLHSRTGYSGSPVFVYRTIGSDLTKLKTLDTSGAILMLLGIHWGQFPELWELEDKQEMSEAAKTSLITDGKYVKGLSGMTCAIPAWEILKMLDTGPIKERRDESERYYMEKNKDKGVQPEPESKDTHEISGDQILENMLDTPPETHEEIKDK